MDGTKANFSFDSESQTFSNEYVGLSDEQRDALVVVLRQFIQKSDQVSIRSLAEVFESGLFPTERRERFRRSRDAIDRELDSDTLIVSDGEKLTYRRVLDIYFNGVIAHRDPRKAPLADAWADGMGHAAYLVVLDLGLQYLVSSVEWLDRFCGFALEEITEAA